MTALPTWDDQHEWRDMKEAFLTVGIKEETRSDIFRAVGAIMNLGDVVFAAGGNDSSSMNKTKVFFLWLCKSLTDQFRLAGLGDCGAAAGSEH